MTGTKVGGTERVTVEFPWSFVLTLCVVVGVAVTVMWFRTGDVIDKQQETTAAIKVIGTEVNKHETRISVLETRHEKGS